MDYNAIIIQLFKKYHYLTKIKIKKLIKKQYKKDISMNQLLNILYAFLALELIEKTYHPITGKILYTLSEKGKKRFASHIEIKIGD